jgi:hypothetical protein
MIRRELAIALRARVTWVIGSLAAVLIGHGLVLAIDLYSAASRSAEASLLMVREMDPLAGVIRPTLGGLDFALALLAPIVAVRPIAVEKERRTFGPLCLRVGSHASVLGYKSLAALSAVGLFAAPAVVLVLAFRALGGHVDGIEMLAVAIGETLRIGLVVAISAAAAAWTRTVAQAASVAIIVSISSWAIDAAEGFAALAWLGGASSWSIERRVAPFLRGVVPLGSVLWLLAATGGALALALVGARFDWPLRRRALTGVAVGVATVALLVLAARVKKAYDWSEERRSSLPPAAVEGLRALPQTITIEVLLDRDDSRRRQLESDVLAKLALARSDLVVRMPLDAARVTEGLRDERYGVIVVDVGGNRRETRSTSRREIVTLVFEAAGQSLPSWAQAPYRGYPTVIEGARRSATLALAYGIVPALMLALGLLLSRGRSGR